MTDTPEKKKTLALFGATGNTGRLFLPAALRAGWAVRAFLRTPAKVADVDGLEKVKGDLTDAAQIAEFVRGADAVACLAGVPRGAKPGLVQLSGDVRTVSVCVKDEADRLERLTATKS